MLYYLVVTVYVLVCFLLMITILLQQGKGGDIANAFGGGSSQAVFGARSGATLLTRATSVLAALFVIFAMMLTVWGQRGPGSVVGGLAAPPAPVAAPAPAAASTAPTSTPAPAATTPAPATPPATPPKPPQG
ncbi:MAG: preprotein translocase subunit SecG [Vicinamibacterales bacterium]